MNRAGCGSQTRGPDRASVRRSGSWLQCAILESWRLSMNPVGRDSVEPGARREFQEETGYVCAGLLWVATILHPSDDGRVTYRLGMFACRYDGVQPVRCFEGQTVEFILRAQAGLCPMPEYVPRVWA